MMTKDEVVERLTRWSALQAEMGTLSFPTDSKRIKASAMEQHEVEQLMPHRPFDRTAQLAVLPFCWSVDDDQLEGGYTRDTDDGLGVACGILDLIASRVCDDCPVPVSHLHQVNWHQLLATFGAEVITPCMTALHDALASLRREHVRYELRAWPIGEDGEPIEGDGEPPLVVASIDSDDPRFEEEGFSTCAAEAEHAVSIVRFDLDEDLFAPVRELVDRRGLAAKRVLLGMAA